MPKRSSKPKKLDVNQLAADILAHAVGETSTPSEDQIKRVMRAMGRKGGLRGGEARAKALSPSKRSQIAKKAAAARWRKS